MSPHQSLASVRHHALSTIAARASATSVLRLTAAHVQSRSLWGWRRPNDYSSKNDAMYYGFTRYRTLKTKAKLLEKLRRRGRWDWDVQQRPFFTPKHVRCASHIGRPRWYPRGGEEENDEKKPEETQEEDGFELSQREKEWKDQMEAMRKRIEQDPYEAVFGKRFEPFWSPLVPTWMREEIGLQRWPKPKDTPKPAPDPSKSNAEPAEKKQNPEPASQFKPLTPEPRRRNPSPKRDNDAQGPEGQLTNYSYNSRRPGLEPEMTEGPDGQLTSYSYGSSTSWDSWTKKARREEWDSISGQTRRYEYDPISNRMVQVEVLKPGESEVAKLESELKEHPHTSESPLMAHGHHSKWMEASKLPESEVTKLETALKQHPKASESPLMSHGFKSNCLGGDKIVPEPVDVPVKKSNDVRMAIAVPTQNSEGKQTSVYFPSLLNTSVPSHTTEPSAVVKVPEKDIDTLTAADVRASVRRPTFDHDVSNISLIGMRDSFRIQTNGKADIKKSQWDQAEQRVMLEQEVRDLIRTKERLLRDEKLSFHIEDLRKTLAKIEERLAAANRQLDEMDGVKTGQGAQQNSSSSNLNTKLETVLDRAADETKSAQSTTSAALKKTLRPSVDRLQSKELDELDDSAAHESTGDYQDYQINVPREWGKQADMLQADRVTRTRGDQFKLAEDDIFAMGKSGARWLDIMNAKKAKYDVQKADEKAKTEARDAKKKHELEKLNAMLQSEIQEQKFRMQAHENRYVHKIRSLRQELDTAYKQSSISADMQVDRIKNLEAELEKAQKAAGDGEKVQKYQSESDRYRTKIGELRKELDTAFKQSATASEKHVERIRHLENELKHGLKKWQEKGVRELDEQRARLDVPTEKVQAEGDMSLGVAKFGKDKSRWYKQPVAAADGVRQALSEWEQKRGMKSTPSDKLEQGLSEYEMKRDAKSTSTEQLQQDLTKYEQKKQDQELVRNVRSIYEEAYGTIDVSHRQVPSKAKCQPTKKEPQVVEVESDVDLGKALADFEKDQQTYQFQPDNLAAEISAQEREAHEAQALMEPETTLKMRNIIAGELGLNNDVYGARILDKDVPHLIPAEGTPTAQKDAAKSEPWSITWEEPPLYKVLAYDSGNDMFSVATASSYLSGKETPVSITQALSELYQPARFVPHFAELQKQGFQVIHGTKDLLVFRKVKQEAREPTLASTNLQDHGLVTPAERTKSHSVNPIDGTSEPATGSFGSPTGFVGDRWDNIVATEGIAQAPSTVSPATTPSAGPRTSPPHEMYSQVVDEADAAIAADQIRHYPRVKREEHVFSGKKLGNRNSRKRHHHDDPEAQLKQMKKKWRSYRRRFRWALLTGVGASVLAYGLGAAVERGENKNTTGETRKERWEQILEERQRDLERAEEKGKGGWWR